MERVLVEHAKLGKDLSADPVHDLRVALRRCILVADVMKDIDPGRDWKSMRKSGRRIFQRLGALRDGQVLEEWVQKLGSPGDATTNLLLASLKVRNEKDRMEAQDAAKKFDRKQWRIWMTELSGRYRHMSSDRPACESLLVEMCDSAMDLHRRARLSRSRVAYHRLRVGLKKFRYGVENFLPSMYPVWVSDLKFLQDLLGEVHDLSVLEQMVVKEKQLADKEVRSAWVGRLEAERVTRVQQYGAKTAGKASPLRIWRDGLPAERELRSAGLARLAEWAYFLTPDSSRVRRVARFSMQLYDGLANSGLLAGDASTEERSILHAAALLQDVGYSKKGKAHHKKSSRMIRKLTPPSGWSKKDLERVALIVRFHRRALPRPDHKILKAYDFPVRQSVVLSATILRFANALHAKPYRTVRRIEVENCAGVILVRAKGFPEGKPLASKLSSAKRLLEFACQRAVDIIPPGTRVMSPRVLRPAPRSDAA
jgi:CHAD domain-containing protein